MADLNQTVYNFLADAQYRVAELSIEMSEMKVRRSEYNEKHDLRAQLILWMDLLYESRDNLYGDAYNYLSDWTERQILAECEYLRQLSGMAAIGYITFAGYSPIIIANTNSGSGANLPAGNENDYIRYDVNGNPITEPFPNVAGMTTETIEQYFS
jgi:hypothetical protein